jgi:hypothetical protein
MADLFDRYAAATPARGSSARQPAPAWDEMFASDREVRRAYQEIHATTP